MSQPEWTGTLAQYDAMQNGGQQPAPAQPAGPTLGQVTQDAGGDNFLQQYMQALNVARQAVNSAKIEPVQHTEHGPGWWLGNVLTFGGLGLAEHDATARQNHQIALHNQALDAHAMNLAGTLVGAQQRAQLAQQNSAIQLLNAQLHVLQTGYAAQRLGLAQHEADVKNAVGDTIPIGDLPKAAPALGALGLQPGAQHPLAKGRVTLVPTDQGWGMPGSAMHQAMSEVSGGGAPAPTQPPGPSTSGPQPGESPTDAIMRAQRDQQLELERGKQALKPLPAQAQKDIGTFDETVRAAHELLMLVQDPEIQKFIGPGRGRVTRPMYGMGFNLGNKYSRYVQQVEFMRANAVGPFLHGSRNEKIWKQIGEHLPKVTDSPSLAQDKLRGLVDLYTKNRQTLLDDIKLTRGGSDIGFTTSTPTSTTTPTSQGVGGATGSRRLSSGKLIIEE